MPRLSYTFIVLARRVIILKYQDQILRLGLEPFFENEGIKIEFEILDNEDDWEIDELFNENEIKKE